MIWYDQYREGLRIATDAQEQSQQKSNTIEVKLSGDGVRVISKKPYTAGQDTVYVWDLTAEEAVFLGKALTTLFVDHQ